MDNIETKLSFCEDLEKIVDVLEGSLSRTKGFLIISYLKTLDFMKFKKIPINQVIKNSELIVGSNTGRKVSINLSFVLGKN